MSDLNSKDSSLLVSLVGVDSSTGETNPVNSNANGELLVKSRTVNSNGADVSVTNPLVVEQSFGLKSSYSASVVGLSSAASATDIFTITGSATKTIRVTSIQISAVKTTSTTIDLVLLKRSTANTGGTSSTLTSVPLDSANAAATATVRAYTANPTTGTLVGDLRAHKVAVGSAAGTVSQILSYSFGGECQPIILRGTGEVLAVNLAATTLTGSSFNIFVEWTEET